MTDDSGRTGMAGTTRCRCCHADAVRLTVIAPDPSDRRELEVCFSCPPASRYRELPRLPGAASARS